MKESFYSLFLNEFLEIMKNKSGDLYLFIKYSIGFRQYLIALSIILLYIPICPIK